MSIYTGTCSIFFKSLSYPVVIDILYVNAEGLAYLGIAICFQYAGVAQLEATAAVLQSKTSQGREATYTATGLYTTQNMPF